MPTQVMAIWPFDPVTREPSVLASAKIDIETDQSVKAANSATAKDTEKPKIDRTIVAEDVSKRSAFSSIYKNKDGTHTLKSSTEQRNFLDSNNTWQKIDNTLEAVTQPVKQDPLQMFLNVAPGPNPPTEFKGDAGTISSQMKRLSEGLVIDADGKTITIKPNGANDIVPEKVNDTTVIYREAWPHVDLQYELRGESVKEIIIVKNRSSQSNFDFTVEGGKVIEHPSRSGELAIEGMSPDFSFSSLTLDVYGRGVISEQRVSQTPTTQGIEVKLDNEWMKSLPDESFPLRIDPTLEKQSDQFGMYKSDGYNCNASNCYANTGTISDNGWKYWRSYFKFDYSALAGKTVNYANMHGTFQPGVGGETGSRWLWMGKTNAYCFHCFGTQIGATTASTDFDIDFTGGLQGSVNANDFVQLWSIRGEESNFKTYKPYYRFDAYVIYDNPTPQVRPYDPTDGQVTVSTQPTLRVGTVVDPDGEEPHYQFRVSTNPDGGGGVITSSWSTATTWTIPDGVLQDGTTYYWRVDTRGGANGNVTVANWKRSFRVDLRTGKDSTQAYDTVGPIGVDLATGNATTSIETHSINALGGSIGLTMNYNTPSKAKNGLKGEYWNVAQNYNFSSGAPTSDPILVRNDQDVNFNWKTSNPGPGVNSDWFYARWKGYFVAPSSGDYFFGSYRDDYSKIVVNNQDVTGGCYGWGPCYGSSINLQSGQVVPISIDYMEAGGDSNINVFVKGPVAEQSINRDWLRSEPVASSSQYGLTGRYYNYDTSATFPTDPNDVNRLMMVRNDPKIAFDWGSGGPASGLQGDKFMTKWTGYITVPADGSYTLGAFTDDGAKITLNNGLLGAPNVVLNAWQDQATTVWGSATSLTQSQQIPITIEYYENASNAQFTLLAKGPGLDTNGEQIPVKWLTPKASALPDAWQLGVDTDGNVGYERLRVSGQNVILEDSTRATHEYSWTGSGFKPPVNEDGQLTRNANNTFTFVDSDGRTYLFDVEGKLTSLTSPSDDRQPSSLKYEYSGDPSRLVKITDGVTNTRYGTLHYKGINEENNCSVPSGFDAAPDGMLCAFNTSDGDVTKLYYKSDQLSRIEKPGSEKTDFGYDGLKRIVETRDAVANDAITANVRTDDINVKTEVGYDTLGRVSNIKAPAPHTGATRVNHTFDYISNLKNTASIGTVSSVPVAGTTVAASWGGARIDLFARGTDSALIHSWTDDGKTWSAWESLGGCIREKPAAAAWKVGRLDILVQGCNDTGNNLHHKYFDVTWSTWGQPPALPGATRFAGAPSVTTWGDGRLDYVVRGEDNKLYHGMYNWGNGWGTPETWNSCISGSPTISSPALYELDIYATGCDTNTNKIIHKQTFRGSWSSLTTQSQTGVGVGSASVSDDSSVLIHAKADQSSYAKFTNGTIKLADCVTNVPAMVSTKVATYAFFATCGSSETKQYAVTSTGATELHISGASEPNGFSKRVDYDTLLRTTKETDVAGLASHTEWDSVKDLELSKTDATGLKSTTIYDDDDRATENYGPAPAAWYETSGTNIRRPLSSYSSQVPKTTTAYDEGMIGPAVNWYNVKGSSLFGAPKLVTQGIDQTQKDIHKRDFVASGAPFTPDSGMDGYGFSATGKVRFPSSGTYTLKIWHDDGVRISIDDQSIINNWDYRSEGSNSVGDTGTFIAEAGKVYRFKFDYIHVGNPGWFDLWWAGPGITDINSGLGTNKPNFVTPGYSLKTSETAYDTQLGNVTTSTTYTRPEYGLVDKTTLDPTGLNLQTSSTYETPGVAGSFLRQTSKTLPGGGSTTYQHYSATDTKDNPCTVGTESINQGGRPKGKVEADPDGAGTQTSRTSETIYNESGEVIATRYNSDAWTCTTYDARGRVLTTAIPALGTKPARTITNDYAKDGNPLVTTTTDSSGTIRVENDLLGRTVKYIDAKGKVTENSYDTYGKLTSRTSPIGIETYHYDNYDRLTVQKLDNVTFATVAYDAYSRLASVQYPAGISLSSITRDSLGREDGTTFTVNGQTYTDSIQRYTSGDIKQGTENGVTKQYSYDNAGRLTGVTIGSNTFAYEFGAPDSSCASVPGYNPNASKNGNRSKMIFNSVATTYCYDMADRLVSSSDVTLTNAQYDAHGNTTSLGDNTHKTEFGYDASDRNTNLKSGTKETIFIRDVQDRVIGREHKENTATISNVAYGFTGSGDSADFLLDGSGNVTQKYLTLPGDVVVTIKPGSTSAGATTYSLPNIHGDIYLTVDADGAAKATHQTGPFGEKLPSQTNPQNTATGTSWNYMGQHQKLTDTEASLIAGGVVQMGARIYIPAFGRFLSIDPIEGAGDNAYSYVNDPVNDEDLDGKIAPLIAFAAWQLGRIAVQQATKIAVQYAAKQSVQQVTKKVFVESVKKGIQKVAPKKVTQASNYSKKLADGRIRHYEKFKSARVPGKMAGSQKVKEFNPMTGKTRSWYQTVDHAGKVRQVRPFDGKGYRHYTFDSKGRFVKKW